MNPTFRLDHSGAGSTPLPARRRVSEHFRPLLDRVQRGIDKVRAEQAVCVEEDQEASLQALITARSQISDMRDELTCPSGNQAQKLVELFRGHLDQQHAAQDENSPAGASPTRGRTSVSAAGAHAKSVRLPLQSLRAGNGRSAKGLGGGAKQPHSCACTCEAARRKFESLMTEFTAAVAHLHAAAAAHKAQQAANSVDFAEHERLQLENRLQAQQLKQAEELIEQVRA